MVGIVGTPGVGDLAKAARYAMTVARHVMVTAAVREVATYQGRCPRAAFLANVLVGSQTLADGCYSRAACWGTFHGSRVAAVREMIEGAVGAGLVERGRVAGAPQALTVTSEGERRLAALFV